MGMDDVQVAEAAAQAAAGVLRDLRTRGELTGRPLGDAGDAAAQRAIVATLAELRPGDLVFSEEAVDDPRRLDADRVWIVDPLDGTREFGEEGRTDWAVHVALWERPALANGVGGLTAAAVALPARRMTLSTDGHFPSLPPTGEPARIAVSRSRRPEFVDALADDVDAVPVPIGSAGMKAMSILLGEADAYVHRGRMKEWDSAAPAAVAAAAGLHVSGLDGAHLRFNTPDRLTLDLLVCQPELGEPLLAGCRRLGLP
jgi:3'(2'), 5'-bisphosphate nucleotidase